MRYLKAFEDNDKPRISGFGPNDFLCTYSNCAEFIKGKIYTGISWRRDNNDIEGKIEGENKSWVEVQMSNKENGTFEYKDYMEDQINLNKDGVVIYISDKIQEVKEFTYDEFINTNLKDLDI